MGIGTYERWPVEKVIVKENVRKNFSEESLRRHAETLKRDGQLRPLLVLRGRHAGGRRADAPRGEARRAYACGRESVGAELSPGEIKKLQLIENLMREGLMTPRFTWRARS